MTNPARPALPAQPALPVTPEELGRRTGGFVGPRPKQPNVDVSLPGSAPSMGYSAPAPAGGPSSPATAPVAPSGGSGLDPRVAAMGLDEKGWQSVLGELSQSTDPEVFKTQFETLNDQRQLVSKPEGLDAAGNYILSKDQKSYYSSKMREAVAFAQAPVAAGGLGYTKNQARMMAILEARKQWPNIPVYAYANQDELADFDAPDVKVGDETVEFGPVHTATLTPARQAEIITEPEFRRALDLANAFKEQKGQGATATDYASYVIDTEVSERLAKESNGVQDPEVLKRAEALGISAGEDGKLSTDEIKLAKAQLDLQIADLEAAGTPADDFKAAKKQMEAIVGVIAAASKPKGEDAIRSEVHKWFLENADTYSTAAAISQLY